MCASITREFIHRPASCGEVLCYLLHLSSFFEFLFLFFCKYIARHEKIFHKNTKTSKRFVFCCIAQRRKRGNQRGLTKGGNRWGTRRLCAKLARPGEYPLSLHTKVSVQRFFPGKATGVRGRTLFTAGGGIPAMRSTRMRGGRGHPRRRAVLRRRIPLTHNLGCPQPDSSAEQSPPRLLSSRATVTSAPTPLEPSQTQTSACYPSLATC